MILLYLALIAAAVFAIVGCDEREQFPRTTGDVSWWRRK